MAVDVITLALAKGYTDSKGSGPTGGPTTADQVSYTNSQLEKVTNVKEALDDTIVVRHSHDNKSVLDKFAESDGKPTYDGKALGGGNEKEIFKIPVTVTELVEPADGESFKVEHTVTLAELEEATKEGKTLTVLLDRAGITYTLPLLYYYSGAYVFYFMVGGIAMYVFVGWSGDEGETQKETWQYQEDSQAIGAEKVSYYNRNNTSLDSVKKALDKLITDSHTHTNKSTLDKLSVADGKLQYDGSIVGLTGPKGDKGDKGDTPVKGTDYWTAADQQAIVSDVLAALPTWTGGSY